MVNAMDRGMTTQAQQIAAMYDHDGQRWYIDEGEDGVDIIETYIEDMCKRHGARRCPGGADVTRWDFADGSCLTMAGGGWDFGYRDCFCWQGVGHTDQCTAAQGE
jgi:hypothetical protein